MSIESLGWKVANIVQKANKSTNTDTKIKHGYVSGKQVQVNGHWYPYDCAVEVSIDDGEMVYVIINDNGNKAVIVGK